MIVKTNKKIFSVFSVLIIIITTACNNNVENNKNSVSNIPSGVGTEAHKEPALDVKAAFNFKNQKALPEWWDSSERAYMLKDDRITDDVEYIGGFNPKLGDVFFIDSKIIVFNENQIKVSIIKDMIKKTFISGDYKIIMDWNESEKTGFYLEGKISLYYKNNLQFNSIFFQSGF